MLSPSPPSRYSASEESTVPNSFNVLWAFLPILPIISRLAVIFRDSGRVSKLLIVTSSSKTWFRIGTQHSLWKSDLCDQCIAASMSDIKSSWSRLYYPQSFNQIKILLGQMLAVFTSAQTVAQRMCFEMSLTKFSMTKWINFEFFTDLEGSLPWRSSSNNLHAWYNQWKLERQLVCDSRSSGQCCKAGTIQWKSGTWSENR